MVGKLSVDSLRIWGGAFVLTILVVMILLTKGTAEARSVDTQSAIIMNYEEQDASRFNPAVMQDVIEEALVTKPFVPPAPSALALYREILVPSPGPGYGKTRSHSHYLKPIRQRADGLNGNSRRWGDAPLQVQAQIVDRIVRKLRALGFAENEVAFTLALVRHESGFNPDAAAGYTSASGLCQMVDATRRSLAGRVRASAADPFCSDLAIACLPEILREAQRFAIRKGAKYGTTRYYELIYAYHHDGPSLDKGGLQIARKEVMPQFEKIRAVLAR